MELIPGKYRGRLSEKYTKRMNYAVQVCQAVDSLAVEAVIKIMLFPAFFLTGMLHSSSFSVEGCRLSISDRIRNRIKLWNAGQYETIWEQVVQQSRIRDTTALPHPEQKEANNRRAKRLAKEGAYGRAAQELRSLGFS